MTFSFFFPQSFRFIISGPIICGKTYQLKNLFINSLFCDKLYIICPTGGQNEDFEIISDEADDNFVQDMKDLPSPDQLPKKIKKLMMFDGVQAEQPAINAYICRARHVILNVV